MDQKIPLIVVVERVSAQSDQWYKFKILITKTYLCSVFFDTPLSEWSDKMTIEQAGASMGHFKLAGGGILKLDSSEKRFFLTMLTDVMIKYRRSRDLLDTRGKNSQALNDLYHQACDNADIRRFLV